MKHASIPSSWLSLGFGWNAELLTKIAAECAALGVDPTNLEAVRAVGSRIRAHKSLLGLIERASNFTTRRK